MDGAKAEYAWDERASWGSRQKTSVARFGNDFHLPRPEDLPRGRADEGPVEDSQLIFRRREDLQDHLGGQPFDGEPPGSPALGDLILSAGTYLPEALLRF